MRNTVMRTVLCVLTVGLLSGSEHARGAGFPPDALTPLYQSAAEHILNQTGMTNAGYCVVFGAGKGRLAYELASRSALTIIGVDEDAGAVNAGRAVLRAEGIYGARITLHAGSLSDLPYEDYAGVLVVSDSIISDGVCTGSAAEMFRMVRPDGGVAMIGQPPGCPVTLSRAALESWLDAAALSYTVTEDGNGLWARIDRGPLPGAGEWTHMWADRANTACSGETRTTTDIRVLWLGGPGPRVLVNRHARAMASLYKRGRLVVPGAHRVICVDAYNGARLWDLPVSDSSRSAIDQDCGWMALSDDYVYVAAQDDCHKVDVDSGTVVTTFHPPTGGGDWGYLAVDGPELYGSEQIANASRIRGAGGNYWYDSHGDDKEMVTSKTLFRLDATNGTEVWRYDGASVIVNTTICMDDNSIYFFESTDSGAVGDGNGRVGLASLTSGASENLVKLNRSNGNVVWRVQRNVEFRHSMYLSYASGVLLSSGARTSGNYVYDFHAYSATDGAVLWSKTGIDSGRANDAHGYQDKHPKIVGDTVYHRYASFDLATGSVVGWQWSTSNCADASASATHVFTRNGGRAYMHAIPGRGSGSRRLDDEVRPGCYINIIAAGGMIMLPAASSGCTCDYPVQMSFGWLPR